MNIVNEEQKEVGLDRLEELFRISPSQVIEVARSDTGMLMLRNKDWEEFKERSYATNEHDKNWNSQYECLQKSRGKRGKLINNIMLKLFK